MFSCQPVPYVCNILCITIIVCLTLVFCTPMLCLTSISVSCFLLYYVYYYSSILSLFSSHVVHNLIVYLIPVLHTVYILSTVPCLLLNAFVKVMFFGFMHTLKFIFTCPPHPCFCTLFVFFRALSMASTPHPPPHRHHSHKVSR